MEQNKIVEQFIQATEALGNTKYILVDKKIAELLRVINKYKDIYNFIAECSINFNLERTLKSCMESGVFTLPDKDHIVVALVYDLLVKFDGKIINITEFMAKYFEDNLENIDAYKFFAITVLNRFEMIVANHLSKTTPKKRSSHNIEVDLELVKRIEFLLESLKQSNTKNNLFSQEIMFNYLDSLISLLKKKQFNEVASLMLVLFQVRFKNPLNRQILKELQQIMKV